MPDPLPTKRTIWIYNMLEITLFETHQYGDLVHPKIPNASVQLIASVHRWDQTEDSGYSRDGGSAFTGGSCLLNVGLFFSRES